VVGQHNLKQVSADQLDYHLVDCEGQHWLEGSGWWVEVDSLSWVVVEGVGVRFGCSGLGLQ